MKISPMISENERQGYSHFYGLVDDISLDMKDIGNEEINLAFH